MNLANDTFKLSMVIPNYHPSYISRNPGKESEFIEIFNEVWKPGQDVEYSGIMEVEFDDDI